MHRVQILGGNGYINEYPTGRLLRDAKLYEIGAGTCALTHPIPLWYSYQCWSRTPEVACRLVSYVGLTAAVHAAMRTGQRSGACSSGGICSRSMHDAALAQMAPGTASACVAPACLHAKCRALPAKQEHFCSLGTISLSTASEGNSLLHLFLPPRADLRAHRPSLSMK